MIAAASSTEVSSLEMSTSSLCVVCSHQNSIATAEKFAGDHQLPLCSEINQDYDLQLCFGSARLELYDRALNTSIYVDFVEGALGHRLQYGGGRGQAIARAIGLKQGKTPSVLDITAGLARDAWILASLGCRLTLVERSPVLAALIEDGISRAQHTAGAASILASGFELVQQDSTSYMAALTATTRPDVIYMDPMYPERKKSALVKKDMQILQHLLGKDNNAEALLGAALDCARKRVVVKRPAHAETVNSIPPSTSISSKKTRYDIYVIEKI